MGLGSLLKKPIFRKIGHRLRRLLQPKSRRPKLGDKRRKKRLSGAPENLQIEGPPARPLPVPVAAFGALEEFALVQLSSHTQRAYRNDLRDFFAHLSQQNRLEEWQWLSPADIAAYRDFLYRPIEKGGKGLAKGSVTRKLAVLKSFYKWARARGWVGENPAELLRGFPQTQDSKTGFLSDAEVERLLGRFGRIEDLSLSKALAKTLIETLLMLGLRRGECAQARVGDLEMLEGRWILTVRGKGNRDRKLPLPPRLRRTLSHWIWRRIQLDPANAEAPPSTHMDLDAHLWVEWARRHAELCLFISTRGHGQNTPLSTSEIAFHVRRAARAVGIPLRVSPHVLRATAITHALDNGASHRGVQQMAGWTSPLMISRYDKRRKDPRHSAVHHLKYANEEPPEGDLTP